MSTELTASGLWLERFTAENADLVLSWRNAPHVRANSLNDAPIAPADHLAFVADLAARQDRHFFILHDAGLPQAVLNVNLTGDTGLWGCYIGGAGPVRPGLFPLLIAVAGSLAFDLFGCTRLQSEVLRHNAAPQKINAFLGIEETGHRPETRSNGETVDVLQYQVLSSQWPEIRDRTDRILTKFQRSQLTAFSADPKAHIR